MEGSPCPITPLPKPDGRQLRMYYKRRRWFRRAPAGRRNVVQAVLGPIRTVLTQSNWDYRNIGIDLVLHGCLIS
jgi:hypothetical protein